MGLTALTVPEQYGGAGQDLVAAVAVIEELAAAGPFLAGPFIHTAFYGGMNLSENGSEAQKAAYLPRLARERERRAPQQRGIPLSGLVIAVFILLLIYYLTPRNRMGPPRGGGRVIRRGGGLWGPTIGGSSWSGWSGGGSFGGGSFGGGFGGFGGGGSGGGGGGSSW